MGCASSQFLEDNNDYRQIGGAGGLVGPHIVSLTSTSYGLLTLDSLQPQSNPTPLSEPEIINSWELMAGLDTDSFRFSPIPKSPLLHTVDSPISRPHNPLIIKSNVLKPLNSDKTDLLKPNSTKFCYSLDGFDRNCPPGGENAVVIYTTTLRGIRKTFEECNAVRAVFEGCGVWVIERDVSMDLGFREELRDLMKGKEGLIVPRVFVRGRYIGGAEEVLRIHKEGGLFQLIEGLPKSRTGEVCDGCGGVRFLPCFQCSGSCKIVKEDTRMVVRMRCLECNENGLVLCPICS
ncbi:glutaredoxin family protein [Tasmannia lanceolata]|uniref:glutaredoxin family protein n=1 Tax=Tasmannia lanceolata TaxID=3420 RepID=UPI004062A880